MSDIPQGYRDIPEEDRKKANVFFDRGASVAKTGNYEYAIEMYLQGLAIDPDAKEAHQALREISLKRKASGGKDLGMMAKMKLPRPKSDLDSMLRSERLMAYNPGDPDNMLNLMKAAHRGGFWDTVVWVGPVMLKANSDSKSPDLSKFLAARDIYVDLKLWRQAVDACQMAVNMKPDDMELQRILKDLGAMLTLQTGNYEEAGSFRDSVRNMDAQKKLMDGDKDIRDADLNARQIAEAEAEYNAEPNEPGKLTKLVDVLVKSESMESENRAIELLMEAYEKTKQFRFRFNVGKIKLNQLRRQERAERMRLQQLARTAQETKDPAQIEQYNRAAVEYRQFLREKNQEEMKEYQLAADSYPTDLSLRFELGVRMFNLEMYNDAIAVLQYARSDPKLRVEASTYLGRAFLATSFTDEAADTLKMALEEYELRGDTRSKELFYWYGHALEQKGDLAGALKSYSQLVQWDFNYRDVQARIKKLRVAHEA